MTYSILVAGCGDIGAPVAQAWQQDGQQVFAMRRGGIEFPEGVTGITGDLRHHDAQVWPEVDLIYLILTPSGRSVEAYQQAYLEGAQALIRAYQGRKRLPFVIFVSSTSVYRDETQEIDEFTVAEPDSETAKVLLATEQLLHAHLPSLALRCTGIYGPGRYRLIEQVLAGNPWGENRWSNRIHRDDVVSALMLLGQQALSGATLPPMCIATDEEPAPLWQVRKYIAEQIGAPVLQHDVVAADQGKRIRGQLLASLGWQPTYPSYREGYRQLTAEYLAAKVRN